MNPACQLEDYAITRLHIHFNEPQGGGQDVTHVNSAFDYSVSTHRTDKNRYRLDLRVITYETGSAGERVGFDLDAKIVGFILFDEEETKEKMEALIRLNGVSILYGILRGIVATVSGSMPTGKFLLPTVMPQDVVRMVESQRQQRKSESAVASDQANKPKTKAKSGRSAATPSSSPGQA